MKTRSFAWAVAIATALPFVLASSRASADSITLKYTSGSINQYINYNDGPGGDPTVKGQVGGGPFNWKVQSVSGTNAFAVGSTIQTWCVDLFQGIAATTTYTLTSVNALPNSTAIKNLFGKEYQDGSVGNNAAFQLALWELIYDDAPGSLASGDFQQYNDNTTRNAATSLVQGALNASGDPFSQYLNGYSLYLLKSSTNQDQLVLVKDPTTPPPGSPVPAPPAALLAAFGVIAFGGRARWLRKKSVA